MKAILILLLSCIGLFSYAQEKCEDPIYSNHSIKKKKDKSEKDAHRDTIFRAEDVNYMTIPRKLKINDKIILVNRSPYIILQAAVVLVNENGSTTPLGRASLVGQGRSFEMASFNNNWLKNIRGKKIGIKIKGFKGNAFDISTLDAGDNTINNENIGNIDSSQITYDFIPTLSENNHDLYIFVTSGTNVFDF